MVESNQDNDTVRLSVPIDREINDTLAAMLPTGLKAQVVRSLVTLFIETQREIGDEEYLAHALLKGRVKLTFQNLKSN